MPLTDTRLRALKPKDKPYKVTDERGLYVEVTPTGSKLWRFRYRIGGAQKKLCIGSYPDISLKQARDAAYEARRAVASGGDPAFEKRKQKIRAEFLSAQTFEAVAREYIEQMMVQNGRADG
ncbi:MAG TPA: integrase, partial [Erythrobacter sp.]|nr:integrase [Erythrobacter sp.]